MVGGGGGGQSAYQCITWCDGWYCPVNGCSGKSSNGGDTNTSTLNTSELSSSYYINIGYGGAPTATNYIQGYYSNPLPINSGGSTSAFGISVAGGSGASNGSGGVYEFNGSSPRNSVIYGSSGTTSSSPSNKANNTGSGGDGRTYPDYGIGWESASASAGSSGVVIIRNHR